VDELEAGAACLALPPIAGDAMADALEAAELLDVDVDQLAGVLPLVAADRLGRLQGGKAIEAEALEDAADGCRRDAELGGDLLAGEALTAQDLDLLDNGCRGRLAQTMRPR
jgi:hypothetical protein